MKWVMPSFLVSFITIIAVALNGRFGWYLRPDQLVASIAISINFVAVTFGADLAKLQRGEKPNLNSTKLVIFLLAALIIGFSSYIGIDLDTDSVTYIAGACATFLTTKGIRDIIVTKKKEAENIDTTQHYISGGPSV